MNRTFAAASLRLLAAAALLVLALAPLDPWLSQGAQALPAPVIVFNRAITDFGTFRWMICGSGLLAILAWGLHRIRRDARTLAASRIGLYVFLTTAAASALVHLAKALVGRARPALFSERGAYDFSFLALDDLNQSFPSGHSAAAGALLGACAMLAPRLRPLFLAGAPLIGASRVVVGAHYPSDVAAGLLLGLWTAIAVAFLFSTRQWLFRRDPAGWPQPKASVGSRRHGPGLDS